MHLVRDLVDGHPEADVRLVGTVVVHRVVPSHPWERIGNLDADSVPEHLPHHSLEGVEDVLLLYEAHLAVDLGELRLAVSTEVLVTETLDDLEVTVVAGNHEKLLEGLRRLRKRVELPRVHP